MFGIDTFAQIGAGIANQIHNEKTQMQINSQNLAQQQRANEENWLHARQMFGWEQLENRKLIQDQREYNEKALSEQRDYDSYKNQKQRLVDAGYNANALLGQFSSGSSPISSPSGSTPSGSVPQSEVAHQVAPQSQNWISTALQGLGDSVFRYQQLDRHELENRLLEANIGKVNADTNFITGAKTANTNASTRNINSRTTAQNYSNERQKFIDSMKNSASWSHEANGDYVKFLQENNRFNARLKIDIENSNLRRYQVLEQLKLQQENFNFLKKKFFADEAFRKMIYHQNQQKIDMDYSKWSREFENRLNQQEIYNDIAFERLENEKDNLQFKKDAMEYASYSSIINVWNRMIQDPINSNKSFTQWKSKK